VGGHNCETAQTEGGFFKRNFVANLLSFCWKCVSAPLRFRQSLIFNKTINFVGMVVKVEWINPHSSLNVEARDADGKIQRWGFELGGPGALRRAGYEQAGVA
jgi:hypothetical protein